MKTGDGGWERLRSAVGDEPPAALRALQEKERTTLALLIDGARREQQRAMQDALERSLGYLPRLLRTPVRRVLFPERKP